MGVDSVNEVHTGTATRAQVSDSATRVFRVRMTAASDGPVSAVDAAGVPDVGDAHPDDSDLICLRKSSSYESAEDQLTFLVTCEYDSEADDSPLNADAEIEWGFTQYQKVAEKDKDGNAIVNSAGQKFDPPLEEQVSFLTLRLTINQAAYNPAHVTDYQDTTNSQTVTVVGLTIGAGEGRMRNIGATNESESGVDYWRVTYEIEYNPDGHARSVLDQGFYELNAAGTGLVRITDAAGQPIDEARNLNGSGRELAVGATPVFIDWDVLETALWQNLNLPTSA